MTDQELEAIAGGYHGDAFGALGPHPAANGKNGWEIRAFLPQAEQVEVAVDGKTVPMERVHAAGVFTAPVGAQPAKYTFRITDYQGRVSETEDVYRFPPLLSDFDLH